MKVFDSKDIREIDAYTISHEPVSSVELMERAAEGCTQWIIRNIKNSTPIRVFTGPGNNGGDGWAIARKLSLLGYSVELFHLRISNIISPDSEINRERLIKSGKVPVNYIEEQADLPVLDETYLVIDSLFGSGLSRPLEGLSFQVVDHINKSGCRIISIDIPSGLFGEDNSRNNPDGIIRADITLTFQFPKRSFFFAENEIFTGAWYIIPIGLHPAIIKLKETVHFFTDEEDIRLLLKKRKKFSHKGIFGHGFLIAGSYGMMGAAILAARACLRSGAGLVTTHVPAAGYQVVQSSVPESIFSIDENKRVFSQCPPLERFSAIAVGPGIGTAEETASALGFLVKKYRKPLIFDADALNIIAKNADLLESIPPDSIITPHPGEFDRLTGHSHTGYERNQKQISFSKKYRLIVILKGAYTSITMPDGRCCFNSSGNPGMATGGSGDVLTGMILSLLAQGYKPEDAALAGVYIHGLAGDIAKTKQSEQSLIASDIIENIGNAFNKIFENEKSVN